MDIKTFDKKYAGRGGFNALDFMKEQRFSTTYIGKHFNIVREQVRQTIFDIYKIKYDPRPERRELIINGIIKAAKKLKPKELRDAYYHLGKDYYDVAIIEIYTRGIYKKGQQ